MSIYLISKTKNTHLSPLLLQDKNLSFQSEVTAGSFWLKQIKDKNQELADGQSYTMTVSTSF